MTMAKQMADAANEAKTLFLATMTVPSAIST